MHYIRHHNDCYLELIRGYDVHDILIPASVTKNIQVETFHLILTPLIVHAYKQRLGYIIYTYVHIT